MAHTWMMAMPAWSFKSGILLEGHLTNPNFQRSIYCCRLGPMLLKNAHLACWSAGTVSMVTFVGSFGKCILPMLVAFKAVHTGADFNLYVFGFLVRMKEVQYAWTIGVRALSGASALALPHMEGSSAVCVTPRPFFALLASRTSQLFRS
jgi:hypothetical protein